MIFCPRHQGQARTWNGTLPDRTVTLMGSSVFKAKMKEDARRIGVSSFPAVHNQRWSLVCFGSSWTLLLSSLQLLKQIFFFFLWRPKSPDASPEANTVDVTEANIYNQSPNQNSTQLIYSRKESEHLSVPSVCSLLMTAKPVWWTRSSKTPNNGNSEYILRVVGPSESQPPAAS